MIWLSWRQFRVNIVVVYAALLAVAAALVITGPHLADIYHQDAEGFLDWVKAQRPDRYIYVVGSVAGLVLPALIGAFWGAPMVARELEAGTHRLVWSQSVSRNRWLATKLGLGMLGAMAASGSLGLATTWWAHPIDKAVNAATPSDAGSMFQLPRLSPELFASRGIVPIGYVALAFALGVLGGAVIRRTVPAMAVTLAAYVVIQIVMPNFIRPSLVAPVETTTTIAPGSIRGIMGSGSRGPIEKLELASPHAGAWVLANDTVDAHGKKVASYGSWVLQCMGKPQSDPTQVDTQEQQSCYDRLASEGYRQHLSYQPASRYWALQWRETSILLASAALVVGVCFWRVRRLS